MTQLITQIENSKRTGTNADKGSAMADIVEYILGEVPGVSLRNRELLSPDRAAEIDLLFRNSPRFSDLYEGVTLHVECKNEQRPISASQVRDFAGKLRDRNQPMGLMVSRVGLSGTAGVMEAGHSQVSSELIAGRTIVILRLADLHDLKHTDELVERVVDRRIELESLGLYRSI